MWEYLPYYLGLGAIAGVLAGLLGIGGGLVIVPALAWLFVQQGLPVEYQMQLAVGSSLATIVPTSLASIRAHHLRGGVRWDLVRRMTPGILLGAAAGVWLAQSLENQQLRTLFGLFACGVALQLLFGLRALAQARRPGRLRLWCAGGVIGGFSALLGIGGGTLTVPFLRWHGVEIRQAVGTAAAAGFPIALAGAMGFLVAGWGLASLPPGSAGFLYWPPVIGIVVTSVLAAPLGAAWAHSLPRAGLQRLFGVILLVTGLRMLVV